jgi:predicted permease
MDIFLSTLLCVAILLTIAFAGFALKKRKMVSESCIPGFSKVLLYVCQPCLIVFSFANTECNAENIKKYLTFLLLIVVVNLVMLGGSVLILWRKSKSPIYRIISLATTFTNCAFFCIPLLRSLFPTVAEELLIYTSIYGAFMNILGWSFGIFIITRNPKAISPKKIFINPAMIGTAVALVIFVSGIKIHPDITSAITTTGNMATPLSMLIMGMRLATMDFKSMFRDLRIYLTVLVKHIVMPLVAFAIVFFLKDVDVYMRRTLFIICACPIASVVLNYSEIAGEGQKTAANLVLFSTIISIATMPFMMLLYPFIN